MTATAVAPIMPSSLLSAQVASLSRAAPYAIPTGGFDTGVIRLVSGAPAAEALPLSRLRARRQHAAERPDRGPGGPRLRTALRDPRAPRVDCRPRRRQRRPGTGHQRWPARGFAGPRGPARARRLHRRRRPGVPRHHRIAELHSARVLPVPVGPNGLDVDALARRLRSGQRIKVLYTVPDFHNPSGGVLPPRPAPGWWNSPRNTDSSSSPTTLTVNTVSSIRRRPTSPPIRSGGSGRDLHQDPRPGLRLGWIVAPSWLAPHLENLRRRSDFHSSVLGQRLITELVTRPGWFDWLLSVGPDQSTPSGPGSRRRDPRPIGRCARLRGPHQADSSCGPRSSTPPSIPRRSWSGRRRGADPHRRPELRGDRRLELGPAAPPGLLIATARPPGRGRRPTGRRGSRLR